MRRLVIGLTGIMGIGLASLAWSSGQEQPAVSPKSPASPVPRPRDLAQLSPTQRHWYLSAQRGAAWLQRANRPDGRFLYGYMPALRAPLEEDHFLSQAGAAFTLGRAARFFADDAAAAIVRQALLTLLLETATEAKTPQVRSTTLPAGLVNRVAAAGLLLSAIVELPNPEKDLLEQGDQLANYLRTQQRPDGSWSLGETKEDGSSAVTVETVGPYAGPAIYALIRSHQQRPAPWKLEAARKALAHYYPWWRGHKHPALVPWLTAASVEVHGFTREQALADAVFDMNDWVCTLQYQQAAPRRPLWLGGFMAWVDGKAVPLAPDASSARLAESLAEACRLARQAGDVSRFQRYRMALERGLQFLTTLQYTEANTQHFADWYRPLLVGAFHASHQDGKVRLDNTQQGVSALLQYLRHVAEVP